MSKTVNCNCDEWARSLKYIEYTMVHDVPDFDAYSPSFFHGSPQEIVDRLNDPANKPDKEVTHFVLEREAVIVCEGCDKMFPLEEADLPFLSSVLGDYLANDVGVEEWKGEEE